MAVNLYQGADPSISAAAGRAGAALKPVDLSDAYESIASAYTLKMKGLAKVLGATAKVATYATVSMIEDVKAIKSDEVYGEHHTKVVFDQLKGLARKGFEIFKEKKGEARKEAREDFRNQWKRSTSALKDMMSREFMNETLIKEDMINKNYLSVDQSIKQRILSARGEGIDAPGKSYDGAYSRLESSEDGKELVHKFFDKDGKPIHDFDSNGEIIYARKATRELSIDDKEGTMSDVTTSEITPLTMTAKDVSDLITKKEPEALANIQAQELSAMEAGDLGLKFRKNEYAHAMESIVDTRNKFNDLTNTPIGNEEYTYAQLLSKPGKWSLQMWATIKSLDGMTDNDGGGIGKSDFEEDDPNDVENLRILREQMLNYENLEARELFTTWLTEAGEKSYNERKRMYDDKSRETGSKMGDRTYMTSQLPNGGARYVTWNQMGEQVDMFKDAEKRNDGQEFSGVDGEQYRFTEGQWEMLVYSEDGNEASFTPADRNTVLNNLHISDRAEWLDSVGEAPVIEGEGGVAKNVALTDDQIRGIKTVWGGSVREEGAQEIFAEILTQFPGISNEMRDEGMFSGYKFSYKGVTYDLKNNDDADKFITALGQQEQAAEEGGFATKFNPVTTQEETSPANQDTAAAPVDTNITSWRSNKDINAKSVDQFNIKGSVGAGKANIFKNNKPIEVEVAGGIATVTGVRAVGNSLIVDVDAVIGGGEKTMGSFGKVDGKYVFRGNKEVYGKLEGQDKEDFDAFVLAVETDPRFGDEILKSVSGTADFNPKDYK